MNYKYKPGDRVRVQAKAFCEGERYHMLSGPLADKFSENVLTIREKTVFRRNNLTNKVVTIERYFFSRYTIKECENIVLWTDDMFVGLANEKECCCESLL